MKLKNKYSKQNIYSNQKFEDQIWYNQQIMRFLNFSPQIFQKNTFLKTKPNFSLTGKCFPLTSFPEGKQTQESLESAFPEITFRKTNTTKKKTLSWKPSHFFFWLKLTGKCFPLTRKCFPLTGNYFPLTNFPNDKQTQESLESGFPESEFRETNGA